MLRRCATASCCACVYTPSRVQHTRTTTAAAAAAMTMTTASWHRAATPSPLLLSLPQFVQQHRRHTIASDNSSNNDKSSSSGNALSCFAAISNAHCIHHNLATEEALLRALTLTPSQVLLLLYRNEACVVVGRNQDVYREVDVRRARDDGVAVARRHSGGGAVYHDGGNVCLSFLTHRRTYAPHKTVQLLRLALEAYMTTTAATAAVTRTTTAPSRHEARGRREDDGAEDEDEARRRRQVRPRWQLTTTERHDLFLDGGKITGSAMRVQRDVAMHHCTLLVSTPRARVGRYLRDGRDVQLCVSAGTHSVRARVTTLAEAGVVSCAAAAAAATTQRRCDADTHDDVDEAAVQVLQYIAHFFVRHGADVLSHAAPWQLTWPMLLQQQQQRQQQQQQSCCCPACAHADTGIRSSSTCTDSRSNDTVTSVHDGALMPRLVRLDVATAVTAAATVATTTTTTTTHSNKGSRAAAVATAVVAAADAHSNGDSSSVVAAAVHDNDDDDDSARVRDACSLCADVQQLRSAAWLLSMPSFCTTVAVTRAELTAALQQQRLAAVYDDGNNRDARSSSSSSNGDADSSNSCRARSGARASTSCRTWHDVVCAVCEVDAASDGDSDTATTDAQTPTHAARMAVTSQSLLDALFSGVFAVAAATSADECSALSTATDTAAASRAAAHDDATMSPTVVLLLHTLVTRRNVVQLLVTRHHRHCCNEDDDKDMAAAAAAATTGVTAEAMAARATAMRGERVLWLERCLQTMLVGSHCDAVDACDTHDSNTAATTMSYSSSSSSRRDMHARSGSCAADANAAEAEDAAAAPVLLSDAALLQGCYMEASAVGVDVAGGVPAAVRDVCVQLLLHSLVTCWRRKNAFDVALQQ